MPIVFACAASHAPGMTAWTEAAPKKQADNFLENYRKLGLRLAGSKPDVIVALTVEHWANFFLNHMPAFCIGRADHYDGPIEEWLRIPKARVPGDAMLAAQLLEASLDSGFRSHVFRRVAIRPCDVFAASFFKSGNGCSGGAGNL